MSDRITISDEMTVGTTAPGAAELAAIARDGFRGLVDLRLANERGAGLAPSEEAAEAARLGLEHRHVPVSTDFLDDGVLHRFRRALIELPKPLFIHCASGKRSGTLALLHGGIEEGARGEEVLARAERLGVAYGSPALREAMRRYVDAHRVATPAPIRGRGISSAAAPARRPSAHALPATTRRVARNTAAEINQRIAAETERRVAWFAAHPEAIDGRLDELDREWDIERVLEANAASIGLIGVTLGALVDRRFLALPAAVSAFLLQHALQGWCPPVPFFRRRGVRTAREIEAERTALKALRGDFDALERQGAYHVARAQAAIEAAWA
jgi:protein tyrosine phosphatase (PTP) superfamily phosphohydrolase (DUF442 family)